MKVRRRKKKKKKEEEKRRRRKKKKKEENIASLWKDVKNYDKYTTVSKIQNILPKCNIFNGPVIFQMI